MNIPKTKWKEVTVYNPTTDWVKETIEGAGTTLGSVHFNKRSNGSLRKMSYRLHVTNPSMAVIPKGLEVAKKNKERCKVCDRLRGLSDDKHCDVGPFVKVEIKESISKLRKPGVSKKLIDEKNTQMTVLDANKVVRDGNGKAIGRGAWRTVPLERVTRIANRGVKYNVIRDGGKLQVHLSE